VDQILISLTSLFGVMASQTLEDVLGDCGVTPQICSILMTAGWTIETFSCVASNESSLDELWAELIPEVAELAVASEICVESGFQALQTKNGSQRTF